MKRFILILLCIAVLTPAFAGGDSIHLRKGHPVQYTVKSGDTLWGIASKFLDDPVQWPKLLATNPQVRNPNKLYPGEVLELIVRNGNPQLLIHEGGTVKLSPTVRVEPLDKAIPAVPIDAIKPFLSGSGVASEADFQRSPIVLAPAGEHLTVGAGDRVYVTGFQPGKAVNFSIYRKGIPYLDPDTGKLLGFAATHVADTRLEATGDPTTLSITSSESEVFKGDRVFPEEDSYVPTDFDLRLPKYRVYGKIIAVPGGVTQIGQWNVVVLNRGRNGGLHPGDLLAIYKAGKKVQDPRGKTSRDQIKLPDEKAGELVVFRVFDQVSYALVLQAQAPLHILDVVSNNP
ncbi:MAG: peptidoglycan-binding protein [Legionellales bacterium]|nr:peptidoglycan-binding protein [Legionellales bacterium]|tara:strand:- start:134972 stop:136003 length:1032 start_codon:yes stop_codon:yes gene_type:complete